MEVSFYLTLSLSFIPANQNTYHLALQTVETQMRWLISHYTVNPLYNDTRYNDKVCYNDNLNVTKPLLKLMVTVNEKLCKNIALKLQATYILNICLTEAILTNIQNICSMGK